ncbi:MAG: 4-hydroxy-tetrahydrodipicolinate reductase [Pseudomonadota bacterium]
MAHFGIIGHKGRMGRALAIAIEEAGHKCAVGVDAGGDVTLIAEQCNVLVDFSVPQALAANLAAARDAGTPILIGTTGLTPEDLDLVEQSADVIPVLQTGNTSLGVTLLAHLVRETTARLGDEWDIEILEMHHRQKVDAPSGTAKLLGEAAADGRGTTLAEALDGPREGFTGMRQPGGIGIAVLRGGTVAGEHSVIFAGDEERVILSHSAENRMIFARGAVRGGAWLIDQAPGRYSMTDVLGL